MDIRNISPDGNVRNIGNRRTSSSQPVNAAVRKDTLSLSGDVATIEKNTVSYEVEPDYPPRQERIEEVGRRVEAGSYSGDLKEPVAARVINSDAIRGVLTEATASSTGEVRTEQLDTARAQARDGFYDSPVVRQTTAENMLSSIDFMGMLR
jgi:hypothetical protein